MRITHTLWQPTALCIVLFVTIFALIDGHVQFERKAEDRVHVSVLPLPAAAEPTAAE